VKIAVYTIALNEEKHVKQWYDSVKNADYLLIADTGSTDSTIKIAEDLGINVIKLNMEKFRFDTARNLALDAIPEDIDYCISLDMDEVLQPGWKKLFKEAVKEQKPTKVIFRIDVIENGEYKYNAVVERGHKRKDHIWKYPVHEMIIAKEGVKEKVAQTTIGIAHYPDITKPRTNYAHLVSEAYMDNNDDPRSLFHFARYLYMVQDYAPAAKFFKKYLTYEDVNSKPHRAEIYRYIAACEPSDVVFWLLKSIKEDPSRREAYVNMAQVLVDKKDWTGALEYLDKAFKIIEKPTDYVNEEFAWGKFAHDLKEQCELELNLQLS
jgi:glycosyltransferase involved in cell wall biosynthesis